VHLLLDTHILLWSVKSDRRLNAAARAIIIGASEVYVSSVSIWEVAIKVANRRLNIDIDALIAEISKNGFHPLGITYTHTAAVANLPLIHRDPFDRMLVAQAMCEPMKLLTADRVLADYSPLVEVI
jgi:PIN domain nuclease of toxin-antitoxin system